MATLHELIARKEALDRQIEEATSEGRTKAIEEVRSLMTENGLSLVDISEKGPRGDNRSKLKATPGTKVAAKYRNALTGETWSGRGLQPRWLKAVLESGKKIEDFAV